MKLVTVKSICVFPIDCLSTAAAAKSRQSCPTLWDPIDGSPPGSPVPGILQARTLEWVAISFSNAWKWKVKVKLLSHVPILATPWTAAYQAPPSMGFSRQEYWSGVPLPSLTSVLFRSSFYAEVGRCWEKGRKGVVHSCLTLSDPMDCSPAGSSIHGIFQARVLEWGAIAFANQSHSETSPHTY